MQEWGKGKLYPHFILENTDPDAGTAEARANSAISTNWATTLVGLIRSKDDTQFNTVVGDYKKFLTDNDWNSIAKVRNEKIAVNKKKARTVTDSITLPRGEYAAPETGTALPARRPHNNLLAIGTT